MVAVVPASAPARRGCQTNACKARVSAQQRRDVIAPYAGWLARVRLCESTGNYRAIDRSGTYTGAYQFDDQTWRAVGGHGRAMQAGHLEQDFRAVILRRRRGTSPWPRCG